MLCVFFFKQKTAYEMRISDWSSDVCSSDLLRPEAGRRRPRGGTHGARPRRHPGRRRRCPEQRLHPHRPRPLRAGAVACGAGDAGRDHAAAALVPLPSVEGVVLVAHGDRAAAGGHGRSEEHTSELQSLMRISYAVFCLKKKKKNTSNGNRTDISNTQ